MKSEPKISIIVPVYNAEKYLHQCLDSILNQSFQDFELLLIDDGSKDRSGKICDEYAENDSRIRVWHQKNQGVSVARNVGLEHAQGEWIYFVDADDIAEQDGIIRLLEGVIKKCKMSVGGYDKCKVNGEKVYCVDNSEAGVENKSSMLHRMFTISPYENQAYLWNKLFNANTIKTNNIRFDPSIKFSEDRLFVVQYLCSLAETDRIYYDWTPVYHYIIHEDTGAMASTQRFFNPGFATDLLSYVKIRKLLNDNKVVDATLIAQASCMKESYRCYIDMMHKFKIIDLHYRIEAEKYLLKGIGASQYFKYYASKVKRKFHKRWRTISK